MEQSGEFLLPPFVGRSAHTSKSLGHSLPARCRARVGLCGVLLGLRPFLPKPPLKLALLCSAGSQVLRRSQAPLERTCPPFGLAPSRTGLDQIETFQRPPGSRACCFSTCSGSSTTQGRTPTRETNASARVAFPSIKRGRRLKRIFRSSIARPADAPVYASNVASRRRPQDTGSRWIR